VSASPILDAKTDELMKPLVEKGLAAYQRIIMRLPERERPIGVTASLTIIREDDFVKHAALCLRHVLFNGKTLYVLCKDDNQLCAVLAHRHPQGALR
jgi:hypothetical protein